MDRFHIQTLEAVRRDHGPVTKDSVSAITGMSDFAVAGSLRDLLRAGLIASERRPGATAAEFGVTVEGEDALDE